jgi:hypothetical protein
MCPEGTDSTAMYLAEFFYWIDPPAGLRWVEECPDDLLGAIDFAQNRRIDEIVAACCPSLATQA